jgi:hypothetical protein
VASQTKPPRPGHRARSAWLSDRVEAAFRFLVAEYGFFGPEVHDQGLTYYSPIVSIEIVYDERAQDVEALACRQVGDRYIRARVSCLIVEAQLGPAQEVKTVARTTHGLDVALASQATAVRHLLAPLAGPEGDALLRSCRAR